MITSHAGQFANNRLSAARVKEKKQLEQKLLNYIYHNHKSQGETSFLPKK